MASEGTSAARAKVEDALSSVRDHLGSAQDYVSERSRLTARRIDDYAYDQPWHAVAIGAGIGVMLGALVARLVSRRER